MMARSIGEIQEQILAAKDAHPELQSLNSPSKVAIWRLWVYIVAVAHWTLESIMDITMSLQTEHIRATKIHSLSWYSALAKAFQFGHELPWGEVEYDNEGFDEEEIEEARVVKFCSVTKAPGGLMVKVATHDGQDLSPISMGAFTAFKEYMFRVSAAGDNLYYRNELPDALKLDVDIYYDPLILDSAGKRLDGGGDTPIADAIDDYIKGIDFNSRLIPMELTDRLQTVEGVKIVAIKAIQTKYSNLAFSDVPDEGVVPFAGYVRIAEEDLNIKFFPAP